MSFSTSSLQFGLSLVLFLLPALSLPAQETAGQGYELRDWTSTQGSTIRARVLRFEERQNIVLQRENGKELTVKLSQLSKPDRDYAARIWKTENPILISPTAQSWYTPTYQTIADAAQVRIEIPGSGPPDFRQLTDPLRVTREQSRKQLLAWINKTKTREPPVYLIDHWVYQIPDRESLRKYKRSLIDFSNIPGLETLRVILIEPVVHPEGFRRGNQVIPPEEMVAMIKGFLAEVGKQPNIEIVPVGAVYTHVLDQVPEWKLSSTRNSPTPRELERIVTMTTITRSKPPLSSLQQSQQAAQKAGKSASLPGLLTVPPEKLEKLAEFILRTVNEANHPGN